MVLIILHILDVVVFLEPVLSVSDKVGIKDTISGVVRQFVGGSIQIDQEIVTIAHGVNKYLSELFGDRVSSSISLELVPDNILVHLVEDSLVLEESGDRALLVPDEAVLTILSGLFHSLHKIFKWNLSP